jgi:hypothetical protein
MEGEGVDYNTATVRVHFSDLMEPAGRDIDGEKLSHNGWSVALKGAAAEVGHKLKGQLRGGHVIR